MDEELEEESWRSDWVRKSVHEVCVETWKLFLIKVTDRKANKNKKRSKEKKKKKKKTSAVINDNVEFDGVYDVRSVVGPLMPELYLKHNETMNVMMCLDKNL